MNAQILRKWSPFKSLMYLWLIFLVLFSIIWCPGALAMHLAPVLKLTPFNRQQQSQPQQNYISLEDGSAQNYSSFSSYSRSKHNLNNINNDNPSRSELDQKLLTTHLHQITNNKNNNSNHHSYYSSLALPLSPDSNTKTEQEVKKSNEIARWRHRMNEKRARILYDRRKLLSNNNTESSDITSRNRRESLTLNPHNNPLRQDREHRRYCSGRDPAVLAFEAPTVFEGKIKSMSHVRRTNYAVTFECVHVYKQPAGFTIPPKVRLNFQTTDNRTECDIYRQDFKQRGQIRGDVLEQGKLYFLFVKQIDVGNFTILGQPIRKTKKTEKEVRLGASSDYGK
uniref:CSON008134 protein n=1 Tax=Culicoides sonorensis TaxID=179676 RepID=A0A336KCT3_CULSO